jgi:16S rRNA processing protein RimM
MMVATEKELVRLGLVTGTHGLRGDIKIRPDSGDPDALLAARTIFLRDRAGTLLPYTPSKASLHKGAVLVRLNGLDTIEAVQPLIGCEVLLVASELPLLAADEFYWSDLQGLAVVDRQRGELGTLEDFFTTAAHDVYVVRGVRGEILIPAVDEFVLEIDTAGRQLLVDLPDGLLPDADDL